MDSICLPLPSFSDFNMAAQKEWFENWFDSRFYPILYDNRDVEEASVFVKHLVDHLKIPANSKLVDIACGEGRFADQLASYGHQVTGLDLSEQRIEKAKELEQDNLSFYVHDMRFPFHINYFDYAFNFFTSFGYFDTARDNHMASHAFASCLKRGGTLVVDYFNKQLVEQGLVPEEVIEKGAFTFYINRYIDSGKIIKKIKVKDETGVEHCYQERVSAFALNDFETLFAKEGLGLKDHFGDYNLNPFDENTSPRLIMIFGKL
jgi:SAM-dependent methyltransferase